MKKCRNLRRGVCLYGYSKCITDGTVCGMYNQKIRNDDIPDLWRERQ